MTDRGIFSASNYALLRKPLTQQIGQLLFQSVVLPFNMQAQTQTNWCWAATSTSVSHYYFFFSHWTQCLVANGELGHSDCCSSPVPSPCNVSWYLDRALQRTLNLDHMVTGTISFQDIKAQIDSGRVIGVRIGWLNDGGHFLAIRGYSEIGTRQYVDVDDPIFGKSHLPLSTFSSGYQGNGAWTHTYFTKRWPPLPFILPELTATAIDKIIELRPLLAIKRGERSVEPKLAENTSLSTPHHVYVANPKDLLVAGEDPVPLLLPTNIRVIETEGEKPKAFYDLSLTAASDIASLSEDAATIELLRAGLAAATKLLPEGGETPELRFLRIPALYVEAFWLHFKDAKKDIYVPVRGIGLFEVAQPVRVEKFVATVRKATNERTSHPGDDTIAP